jgi:hypothetical protein
MKRRLNMLDKKQQQRDEAVAGWIGAVVFAGMVLAGVFWFAT